MQVQAARFPQLANTGAGLGELSLFLLLGHSDGPFIEYGKYWIVWGLWQEFLPKKVKFWFGGGLSDQFY
ncbi:hypothetical protein HY26_17750 [Hyphomonas sp. GM-8P]|nr:hypothetical protein HY26_17750 [Hyphomonas sp. GM-8P]